MEPEALTRIEGWEARLAAVIAAANERPYVLGEHDCLRVTCAAVEALTGRDMWPAFAGYRTRREALRVIAAYGETFGDAVSKVLGAPMVERLQARRGDIVLYRDREPHLGVCVGARVAVTTDAGLFHVPLNSPGVLGAWRIG